jgi:radical SAM protein (TIGR01212 family)
MKELYFFSDYLKGRYGKALYRVPVSLPLSCPHRDKNSGKGCIFCADDGAKARHLKNHFDLKKQISTGIEYVQNRYKAEPPYIAYLQAFTNTNAPVKKLRELYSEVLGYADFKVLIISTRPDCLPPETMDYLRELNEEYDLWVELGVQSTNDKTLEFINRQHDFACVKEAVEKLDKAGIKSVCHVILGLPGETAEDFQYTAKEVSALPFSAIKIHNLLVLKNTPLAKIYANQPFEVLNEYEYADILADFIRELPDNWPLMRITADADEQEIIAPKWWMKKGQFLEYFKEKFEKNENGAFPGVKTNDGSYTFYHPEYRQNFHTISGARTEAEEKFINPCKIPELLQNQETTSVLDIGFGLGYNALAVIDEAKNIQSGNVKIVSLEKDNKTLEAAQSIFSMNSREYKIIQNLLKKGSWQGDYASISIHFDDARKAIKNIKRQFDVIFLDAFSPDKNPELWSYDFIRELASRLLPEGIIATYSSAYPVRGAMFRCGLQVGETSAFGRKRGGTVASYSTEKIIHPLTEKEKGIILKSTAGLPYRDPGLILTRKKITDLRKKTMLRLRQHGVPRWYKP